jgi:3-dehydroquinate synthase
MRYTISFPTGDTEYMLRASYSQLLQVAPVAHSIIITDNNIHRLYGHLFSDYRVLIIDAGASSKTWETIQVLAEKLAQFEAHKKTKLIGIGGGTITDIVGFLASIYMRGVSFAFVPTSLLGMIDASIGGKNGINVGFYKNMLGTIQQPEFILLDTSFLETLPLAEWSNGFAEIIKYGCIKDPSIFHQLSDANLNSYKIRPDKLNALIALCVQHKNEIVLADEQEKDLRKTLNFGHTSGHAFETLYHLDHGQAVAMGMIVALIASEQQLQLSTEIRSQLVQLLNQFGLSTQLRFDVDKVIQTLKRDKKRQQDSIDFILLSSLGKACIHPLSFDEIRQALQFFADAYKP